MIDKIPVILHHDDYVIIKEDGDFLRFNNGQIVIYRDLTEALNDLQKNEKVASCLYLTSEQKEQVKESIRKYTYNNETHPNNKLH